MEHLNLDIPIYTLTWTSLFALLLLKRGERKIALMYAPPKVEDQLESKSDVIQAKEFKKGKEQVP